MIIGEKKRKRLASCIIIKYLLYLKKSCPMPKIPTVDYCPSDASQVYTKYVNLLKDHPNVLIDFKNQQISPADSSAIFGRLLIIDARHSVLCKNLDGSYENVSNLVQGINDCFHQMFPQGIRFLIEPQIEIYDPTGEGIFIVVKLGIDAYEAVYREKLARNINRR